MTFERFIDFLLYTYLFFYTGAVCFGLIYAVLTLIEKHKRGLQ